MPYQNPDKTPTPKNKVVRATVMLPVPLHTTIKELAKKQERSISSQIIYMLRNPEVIKEGDKK
jgi:hypothetical protein